MIYDFLKNVTQPSMPSFYILPLHSSYAILSSLIMLAWFNYCHYFSPRFIHTAAEQFSLSYFQYVPRLDINKKNFQPKILSPNEIHTQMIFPQNSQLGKPRKMQSNLWKGDSVVLDIEHFYYKCIWAICLSDISMSMQRNRSIYQERS